MSASRDSAMVPAPSDSRRRGCTPSAPVGAISGARTASAELGGVTLRAWGDGCLLLGDIDPSYVSHFINSLHGRRWIRSVVSQQVGQANVNGSKLSACTVPLPPQLEQRRIVTEIERAFSLVFATSSQLRHDLERCQRLRQSILMWAFEGRLADQDLADEPVSALLARIKSEREQSTAEKPARPPRDTKKKQVQA